MRRYTIHALLILCILAYSDGGNFCLLESYKLLQYIQCYYPELYEYIHLAVHTKMCIVCMNPYPWRHNYIIDI